MCENKTIFFLEGGGGERNTDPHQWLSATAFFMLLAYIVPVYRSRTITSLNKSSSMNQNKCRTWDILSGVYQEGRSNFFTSVYYSLVCETWNEEANNWRKNGILFQSLDFNGTTKANSKTGWPVCEVVDKFGLCPNSLKLTVYLLR